MAGADPYRIQLVAYTFYNICFCRNQVIFNAGKFIPSLVAADVMERVQGFNEANLGLKWRKKVIATGNIPNNLKGHTLLHVDAGCFHDGTMAMRCILSACNGDNILSATKKDILGMDPSVAEVVAIRWALNLAAGMGIDRLLVFSDALEVVDSLNGINMFASLDPVISNCLSFFFLRIVLLCTLIEVVILVHILFLV